MVRKASEVRKGDLLVTSAVRVQSAMTESDHTYVSYEGIRLIDSFNGDDVLPSVYPSHCPQCGYQLVEEEHE